MVKMTVAGLRPGQKVISVKGRDSGREYLIIGFAGEYFLLLADGWKRSVKNPKKKNIRHVQITLRVDKEIEEKLSAGRQVSDDELRRALHRLGPPEGEAESGEEEPEKGEIDIG